MTLGNACARIVTAISTNPPNDIIEVLRSGSLFSDVLQESWRHQLSSYKIVSFYEGIGEVDGCKDRFFDFSLLTNLRSSLDHRLYSAFLATSRIKSRYKPIIRICAASICRKSQIRIIID